MAKYTLPVHPEEVTKRLFLAISKRTKDVMEQRFGLNKSPKRMTLEAIGQKYGITRERVRQIEADGMSRIKKSQAYSDLKGVFVAMEQYFDREGGVLKEATALGSLVSHPKHENHVYFLLSLHDPFERFHETDSMHDRWSYGKDAHEKAKHPLEHAVGELRRTAKPVSEAQLFEVLTASSHAVTGSAVAGGALSNWLELSKLISKNYFNEWGLVEFPEIRPRGVRDLSHMVLTRCGKPLHFSDVAIRIGKLIGKPVHVQTVHNELIKDPRFVLVGRGLYALQNWGYAPGVVRDIISGVLGKNGPMAKEKIIAEVLHQRFVKPNTVFINLENKKYFKKLADGRYNLK